MTPSDQNSELIRYAVRFTPRAAREMLDIAFWLADITGDEERGTGWYRDMRTALANDLTEMPERLPIRAMETRYIGLPVRRLLSRRTATSQVAIYFYYVIAKDSQDGPVVTVVHVRHASCKPLSAKEAKELKQEL